MSHNVSPFYALSVLMPNYSTGDSRSNEHLAKVARLERMLTAVLKDCVTVFAVSEH